MTLNQLQYFVVTAEELHYGRAAHILHIAQPSLSIAIANLEQELGLALFERQGRGIHLTEAGALFKRQAENILAQVGIARLQLAQYKQQADQVVSLAYTSTMIAAGLPQALCQFAQSCPAELTTDEASTPEAIQGLKDCKYDLAICMKAQNEPELVQTPLLQAPNILIAPQNSPLTNATTLAEVAALPFVIYRSGPARAFLEELFRTAGLAPNFCHYTYSDTDTLRFVAAGLGISVVVSLPYPGREAVKVLRPAWLKPYTHDLYLTHLVGRPHGKAARQLQEHLLQTSFL